MEVDPNTQIGPNGERYPPLPAGTDFLNLVPGDYVELFGWQNSGGSLNLTGSSPATSLIMQLTGLS